MPLQGYEAKEPPVADIETTFAIARTEQDPQRFSILFQCDVPGKSKKPNVPYRCTIALSGDFRSMRKLKPTAIPAGVVNNALTILYGVARGIVGQATAAAPAGKFVLPAVTFDSLVLAATKDPDTTVVLDEWLQAVLEAEKNNTSTRAKDR